MREQKPISQPCTRCGNQPHYITSMLDPTAGGTFHMFECECGDKFWVSDNPRAPEKK
jgi:hypothetical protein